MSGIQACLVVSKNARVIAISFKLSASGTVWLGRLEIPAEAIRISLGLSPSLRGRPGGWGVFLFAE